MEAAFNTTTILGLQASYNTSVFSFAKESMSYPFHRMVKGGNGGKKLNKLLISKPIHSSRLMLERTTLSFHSPIPLLLPGKSYSSISKQCFWWKEEGLQNRQQVTIPGHSVILPSLFWLSFIENACPVQRLRHRALPKSECSSPIISPTGSRHALCVTARPRQISKAIQSIFLPVFHILKSSLVYV